jgi:hypothetical protein
MDFFEIVVIVVCAISALVAAAAYVHVWELYDRIAGLDQALGKTEAGLRAETRERARDEVRDIVRLVQATRGARGETPFGNERDRSDVLGCAGS